MGFVLVHPFFAHAICGVTPCLHSNHLFVATQESSSDQTSLCYAISICTQFVLGIMPEKTIPNAVAMTTTPILSQPPKPLRWLLRYCRIRSLENRLLTMEL
ncbi:hypothetical protein F5Y01DRAFT_83008 [Xylaria sp. FL0043]|nr:hypothetical protein F5Y01DRAFT_83008 [Xylaria sp. FL0043]